LPAATWRKRAMKHYILAGLADVLNDPPTHFDD
jgi:hypothetical protein